MPDQWSQLPGDLASSAALAYARHGDPTFLGQALSVCADAAFTQARRLLRSEADAEDAVQDAFLILAQTAQRYDGSSPFGAWVSRQVHFSCLNLIRRQRPVRIDSAQAAQIAAPEPRAASADAERVATEVRALPERFRSVVDLHYFGGLSLADTASVLGLTNSAVGVRLHRAREMLRQRMTRRVAGEAGVVAVLVAQPWFSAPQSIHAAIAGPVLHAASTPASATLLQKGWSHLMHHPMFSILSIAGLVIVVALTLPSAERPAAADKAGMVPTAAVTQVFYANSHGYGYDRNKDAPKDFTDFNPCSLQVLGDYLYTGSSGKSAIHYFKRDARTAALSFAGMVTGGDKDGGAWVHAVGARLYAIRTPPYNRIAWYDIEAQTGKPLEKGSVPLTTGKENGRTVNWVGEAAVSKDRKNLYVMAEFNGWALMWYRLGPDGAAVKAGEVAGKGIEASILLAPDGNHLYCMSREAIACLDMKPSGEPVVTSTTALDPKWNVKGDASLTMSFTPDGRWLYANLWYQSAECFLGIFKRDPATGALTLQEAGSGNDSTRADFRLANARALNLVFMPDGLSGFAGSASTSVLRSFRRDPKTGRLADTTDFPEWDLRLLAAGPGLWLDGQKEILYGIGLPGNVHGAPDCLWVAKVGKGLAKPTVTATLTGNAAPKGAAAKADWPHWRGPTYDGLSPLKGIRKDWTGGLKKVWEVEGLSPGRFTWSTVAVQGDRAVVSGRHGAIDEVFCFDADKGGQPVWTAEFEGNEHGHFMWGAGPHATPTISGDKVFCANLAGTLVCSAMADGKILWKKQVDSGPCSPLVSGDLVVMANNDDYWHGKYLTAMNKATGEVVWTYGGGACNTCSSPVLATIDGKQQIVAIQKTCVFGVEPASGKEIWRYNFPAKDAQYDGSPLPTPVVWDNLVWPNVQLDKNAPTKIWPSAKPGKQNYGGGISDPIVVDGCFYQLTVMDPGGGNPTDGWLVCKDAKTGDEKWAEHTGAGSMVWVDGCLLCLTYAGDLLLVEAAPAGFKKLGEMKGVFTRDPWQQDRALRLNNPGPLNQGGTAPCWASPTVARGKIYLHYSDRLACYDLMN